MPKNVTLPFLSLLLALSLCGFLTSAPEPSSGENLTTKAQALMTLMSPEEKEIAVFAYDNANRVDWHFIPKPQRKGLMIGKMSEAQKEGTVALLKSCLSSAGNRKTKQIMELESVLHELEKGKNSPNVRDPLKYYVTIFGEPNYTSRWGLSFEGHHLSLNFVVESNKVISSTPEFFGASPGVVKSDVAPQVPVGTAALKEEEDAAFDLLASLSKEETAIAIVSPTAPADIRAAGAAQPPIDSAVGIRYEKMSDKAKERLRSLLETYLSHMAPDIAKARQAEIDDANWNNIHFAWFGATERGIGHAYRVQGPTFLIEFNNTQPDPAGNIANHIHAIWRNRKGDFAIPIAE